MTPAQITKMYDECFVLQFDEISEADLFTMLKSLDALYLDDDSPLTDAEYDEVRLFASKTYPNHPYFKTVGAAVPESRADRATILPHQMGSLTQAQLGGELSKWVRDNAQPGDEVVGMDKLDGISCQIGYSAVTGELFEAFTRGDGYEGEDITQQVLRIPNVPKRIDVSQLQCNDRERVSFRAELIVKRSNEATFLEASAKARGGKPYKNLRNGVAGAINKTDTSQVLLDMIEVVVYDIMGNTGRVIDKLGQFSTIQSYGMTRCDFAIFKAQELLNEEDSIKFTEQRLEQSEYELDGVVYEFSNKDARDRMDYVIDGLNPQYARKFKILSDDLMAVAKVIGVVWGISKHGYLKPRINVEPVEVNGVTISYATGFNGKFIVDNGIGPGAEVVIVRSGGVIPYIQQVTKKATPDLPTEYDYSWTSTGVDMVLNELVDIKDIEVERTVAFFRSLDIANLGEGNVGRLYDAGMKSPADIINASEAQLGAGVGSDSIGTKIYDGIHSKLQKGFHLYQLMGATHYFGRGVGVRKMKLLHDAFGSSFEDNIQSTIKIDAVDGFDDITAQKIVAGLDAFDQFAKLIKDHVNLIQYQAPASGKFDGMSFVFTEVRSKDAEARIVALGGKISSGVSKKTSYLVAGDVSATTGKAGKAQQNGVPIITLDELWEIINE